MFRVTCQDRADFDIGNAVLVNQYIGVLILQQGVLADDDLACVGVHEILNQVTADKPFGERLNHFLAVADIGNFYSLAGAAVIKPDDYVLRYVNQPAGKVPGVGGTQRGVGKALARAAGGEEVFQHVQALAVVGADWHLDGAPGGIGNQPAHAGELADLRNRAARARIRHHEKRIVWVKGLVQSVGYLVGGFVPRLDDHAVTFLVADKPAFEQLVDGVYPLFRLLNILLLFRGDCGVGNRHGQGGAGGIVIAQILNRVQNLCGFGGAVDFNTFFDNQRKLFFADLEINLILEQIVRRLALRKV